MPSTPPEAPLFRLDEVPDGDSAGFTAEIDGYKERLMAIRRGEQVFVYINSCPHVGAPLDWTPGQFLTRDKKAIQCTAHGAMFQIEDGQCFFGPCHGESLIAIPVTVRDGAVHLVPEDGATA